MYLLTVISTKLVNCTLSLRQVKRPPLGKQPLKSSKMNLLMILSWEKVNIPIKFITLQSIPWYCSFSFYINSDCRRCPKIVQKVAPSSALKFDEKAWNSFPYCKTGTIQYLCKSSSENYLFSLYGTHIPDDKI